MHISKFLDAFVLGPNVEIVEPFRPDMLRGNRRARWVRLGVREWVRHFSRFSRSGFRGHPKSSILCDYASRKTNLKSLHNGRRSLLLRFANQKVNMFRHDHVTNHDKLIASAHLLQNSKKQIATARSAEQLLPPITTARDEM